MISYLRFVHSFKVVAFHVNNQCFPGSRNLPELEKTTETKKSKELSRTCLFSVMTHGSECRITHNGSILVLFVRCETM